MPRLKVSNAMVGVLLFAVGLAALRNANELWVAIFSLITLVLIGAALLGVVLQRGRLRARCLGFFIFAGGYVLLAFGPGLSDKFEPMLVSTQVLQFIYSRAGGSPSDEESARLQGLVALRRRRSNELASATRLVRSREEPSLSLIKNEIAAIDAVIAATPGYGDRLALLPAATGYLPFLRVGHWLCALMSGIIGLVIANRLETWREVRQE